MTVTAIRGFGVGEGMRIEPRAVSAVGQSIGESATGLRRACADSSDARFGPNSVGPALRDHGVAYAAGMAHIAELIDAVRETADHLAVGFDSAAIALRSRDDAVSDTISDAGRM